jgi:hypothetical protein
VKAGPNTMRPSDYRAEAAQDLAVYKGDVADAFDFGNVVAIRTAVRQEDRDARYCPLCWDPVRNEASDPYCPVCYGNGFVSTVNVRGYRPRIFARAHLGEISDKTETMPTGRTYVQEATFYIAFTERELHDGDLLAEVETDDVDDPSYVVDEVRRWELIDAQQPKLHPGYHPDDSVTALGQVATASTVQDEMPEASLNMDENYSWTDLSGADLPDEAFAHQELAAVGWEDAAWR